MGASLKRTFLISRQWTAVNSAALWNTHGTKLLSSIVILYHIYDDKFGTYYSRKLLTPDVIDIDDPFCINSHFCIYGHYYIYDPYCIIFDPLSLLHLSWPLTQIWPLCLYDCFAIWPHCTYMNSSLIWQNLSHTWLLNSIAYMSNIAYMTTIRYMTPIA